MVIQNEYGYFYLILDDYFLSKYNIFRHIIYFVFLGFILRVLSIVYKYLFVKSDEKPINVLFALIFLMMKNIENNKIY